jgi:hypothetical protein
MGRGARVLPREFRSEWRPVFQYSRFDISSSFRHWSFNIRRFLTYQPTTFAPTES